MSPPPHGIDSLELALGLSQITGGSHAIASAEFPASIACLVFIVFEELDRAKNQFWQAYGSQTRIVKIHPPMHQAKN